MGTVVTYGASDGAARVAVAKGLAALLGFEYGGAWEPSRQRSTPLYFVPSDTLSGAEAGRLGIRGATDLFGGVVPHPFVAHRAVAYPLAGPDAHRPRGWTEAFPQRVHSVVLPGFAAFARDDARQAGERLLADGPVRVGSVLAQDASALRAALAAIDPEEFASRGVVLEAELAEEAEFVVGQVRVDGLCASYCGGDELVFARGGFAELLALEHDTGMRLAIHRALTFDEATGEYAGLFASRRSYLVRRGRDARGRWHCGVREHSWRIGGASGPEVAALRAFRAEPERRVYTSSKEAPCADSSSRS